MFLFEWNICSRQLNLRRVWTHGFWFPWRLRWPSVIHQNDSDSSVAASSAKFPQSTPDRFFSTAASGVFEAHPWLVKWNIPFAGIFQTVLKAGFCLVRLTRLCCPQPLCHVIPEVVALFPIRAAVNHLRRPLRCNRSGCLLGSRVPCDVGLDRDPPRWTPPASRTDAADAASW